MNHLLLSILFVSLILVVYWMTKQVYLRFPHPLLLPITTTTAIIIIVLLLVNVDYDTFMIGGQWVHAFLGPAVVALAYPLYLHRKVLIKYSVPIITGSFIGAVVGIGTGVILTRVLQFEEEIIFSIAPKSVTTAVAMEVSDQIGGIASLAAVFVTIAGISGVILNKIIFNMSSIHSEIGRGVGMGSASHAIGTAKMMEQSFFEGSIATVAMIVSAVVVSIILPIMLMWI